MMWYIEAEIKYKEANDDARRTRAIKLGELFYSLTGEVIPTQSGIHKLDYHDKVIYVYFTKESLVFFEIREGCIPCFSFPCSDVYEMGSELAKINRWSYAKPSETWFQADFIRTFPDIKVAF